MVEEGLHYNAPGQIAPYTRTRVYHSTRAKQLTYICYVNSFACEARSRPLLGGTIVYTFAILRPPSKAIAHSLHTLCITLCLFQGLFIQNFVVFHIHSPFNQHTPDTLLPIGWDQIQHACKRLRSCSQRCGCSYRSTYDLLYIRTYSFSFYLGFALAHQRRTLTG